MRSISYDDYYDKALGGWTGKCLGGTVGCFEGTKQITNLILDDLVPDKPAPNDDLDIQLVWLDVLLEHGVYFTSDQLMEAWLKKYPCNYGEYATGRRNYRRGLHAPACGSYANRFFSSSMGCPIRSEVWGMISPGSPDLAARYAETDGTLDHPDFPAGESVCAERFLAAVESEAFFESDIEKLILSGMRFVPEQSRLYACIRIALDGFRRGDDWRRTWRALRDDYGSPDCSSMPISLGITVMALLCGGGDIERTLTIAINSGWDVDCTCSTSAALLGIIYGWSRFPGKWKNCIGDGVATMAEPSHKMDSLRLVAEYTCRAGITLQPRGTQTVVTGFTVASGCAVLPDTNMITASFENHGTLTFGLCGSPAAMVSRIFSDCYMDWLNPGDIHPARLIKSGGSVVIVPDLPEEWGNHRVDIDKKYIEEDFSSPAHIRAQLADGRITGITGDAYVISDVYGYAGPVCVYYYEEIYCPDDRGGTAFCGSSDPFKIWLNGTVILSQNDCRWWYPNHYVTPIHFKKGLNTLVIKIARYGEDNRLTLAFRHEQTVGGFDSAPYMTDLSYGTFK